MKNELYSVMISKATTEKLLKSGLVDKDSAMLFLKSVNDEISEHFERISETKGITHTVDYFESLYREAEMERDERWKSA